MLHYLHIRTRITIKQSYTHTVQQMHMQKVMTRQIEAKKVYSHWSQLEYRSAMTNLWLNSSHLDLLCLVATQLNQDTSSSRVIFFQFNGPWWSWTVLLTSLLRISQPEKASLVRSDTSATKTVSLDDLNDFRFCYLMAPGWLTTFMDTLWAKCRVTLNCFHALYQYLFSRKVVERQYAKSSWNPQFSTS